MLYYMQSCEGELRFHLGVINDDSVISIFVWSFCIRINPVQLFRWSLEGKTSFIKLYWICLNWFLVGNVGHLDSIQRFLFVMEHNPHFISWFYTTFPACHHFKWLKFYKIHLHSVGIVIAHPANWGIYEHTTFPSDPGTDSGWNITKPKSFNSLCVLRGHESYVLSPGTLKWLKYA